MRKIRSSKTLQPLLGLALRANLANSAKLVRNLAKERLTSDEKNFLKLFRSRFLKRQRKSRPSSDEFLTQIIQAYEAYWIDAFLDPSRAKQADNSLRLHLIKILHAHEAQHFADYKRFPKMVQHELEYRAKLAELFRARRTSRKLLKKFTTQAHKTKASPHAFANDRVIEELSRRLAVPRTDLHRVSASKVSAAARALLIHDSKTRS